MPLVPALVSYIALFYIVHLEAMKMNLAGIAQTPVFAYVCCSEK